MSDMNEDSGQLFTAYYIQLIQSTFSKHNFYVYSIIVCDKTILPIQQQGLTFLL